MDAVRASRVLGLLTVVALAGGCSTTHAPPDLQRISTGPIAPTTAPPDDLERALTALERIHPDPFHDIARSEFVAQLEALRVQLDTLTREQVLVEVMRLWALLGEGEGHQLVLGTPEGPNLPIRVFEFSDGVFVTDALDPSLVGARVTAVGGQPVEQVLALLAPLVPRDSEVTVRGARPSLLLRADILVGLGLAADNEEVELTLDRGTRVGEPGDAAGPEPVRLRTISHPEHLAWTGTVLGFEHLPPGTGFPFLDDPRLVWGELVDGEVAYVRHRESLALPREQLNAVEGLLADPAVQRVVLDLRHNPGGNLRTQQGLLRILREAGHPMTVLVDRHTFSAAAHLAFDLEADPGAVFVGEPTGGAPHHYADVQFIRLSNLPYPLKVGISTRYWEKTAADDPRDALEPSILHPWTSSDFFGGTDPALAAALGRD